MVCKKCNKYEIAYRNECKICGFKKRRKEDLENVLSQNYWTEEEIETVLYNILYGKVECLNDVAFLLENKSLEDLVGLITEDLVIRGLASYKIKVKCEVCGVEYLINPSVYKKPTRNYCSFECRNQGFVIFGSHKGANNSKYNSSYIECTNCKKLHLVTKSSGERTNSHGDSHNFCSQQCYWEYRSRYYVKDKHHNYGIKLSQKRRIGMSERITKRISEGKFAQTMTKPHIAINKILEELGVVYQNEFNLKYQCLDIYLPALNLGIEIMGDYWHANPLKYKYLDLGKRQLKDIKQDKRKYTYTEKYYKFKILYLWESEIKDNPDLCKKLILLYLKNKGVLEDYNSFNYTLDNNLVKLNKKIIHPYFLIQNP